MSGIKEWIQLAKERGASDLHIESGTPVVIRVRGELVSLGEPLSSEFVLSTARGLLDSQQWQEFTERRSADLSRTLAGTRCRLNLFQTVKGVGLAVRLLSSFQNNLQDCNLHPDLKKLVQARSGLIIVSGPTGSGKSTTLAALIEEINLQQRRHIIAIESPIEYFFQNRKSFIRQREIPTHSPSFEQAIVDSMRENPDVLVIGEMRTPDVMRLTLNAAETGHLVLATMHSSTCAEALARISMSFSPELQGSVRAQLADCLVGVVCQRLDFLPQLQLRIPLCEILLSNSAAKTTIRSGQFSQMMTVLQSGGEEGMFTFDRYQRWIDQKKDWVRPGQGIPLPQEERLPEAKVLQRAPSQRAPTRSLEKAKPGPVPKQGEPIEIDIAEEDLASLASKIESDEG